MHRNVYHSPKINLYYILWYVSVHPLMYIGKPCLILCIILPKKHARQKIQHPTDTPFCVSGRNLGPGVTWRPIYYPADVLFSRALTRFVSLINGFKKSLLSHILRTVDQEYWNVLAYFTKRSPALYSGNYDGKEKVWISFFSLYIIWNFKGFAKEYRLLLSMHLTAQTETNC